MWNDTLLRFVLPCQCGSGLLENEKEDIVHSTVEIELVVLDLGLTIMSGAEVFLGLKEPEQNVKSHRCRQSFRA